VPVDLLEEEVLTVYETPENRQLMLEGCAIRSSASTNRQGHSGPGPRSKWRNWRSSRGRLAWGVVEGSIPSDLAKVEQARIRDELTAARRTLATAKTEYPAASGSWSEPWRWRSAVLRSTTPADRTFADC
jgi:hypothetical protein